jgi:hypothetical protein
VIEKEGGRGTEDLELEVGQHDQLHPQELLPVVTSGAKAKGRRNIRLKAVYKITSNCRQ